MNSKTSALRILIPEGVEKEAIDLFQADGQTPIEILTYHPQKTAELEAKIAQASALWVRSATAVTSSLLEKAQNLKVIGMAGSGVDHIDLIACKKKGVRVIHTPDEVATSAAELAIGLLIATSRQFKKSFSDLASSRWDRPSLQGLELSGKTLGIVGLGRIGREVAIRMNAFKMKVIAYDPYVDSEIARSLHVRKSSSLEDLLKTSDFVSFHVPLTDETENMLHGDLFKALKKEAIVINTSRGQIISEADLLSALNQNLLSAYGCDVFAEEPPFKSELLKHPRVTATSHIGAQTKEARLRSARVLAERLIQFLVKGEIVGEVKMDDPHSARQRKGASQ